MTADRMVLMNPGPVNTDSAVRAALAGPDACHREAEFSELQRRVRRKVVQICGAGDSHASVVLTGSGTAALEAAITSVPPADAGLLVIDNGHYGRRLLEIARCYGIRVRHLEFGWGVYADPAVVKRALQEDPWLTHTVVVHHETSTGMLNDVRAIAGVTREQGRISIVDAISSLGAESLDIIDDDIDWVVGTANKCLEGMPGISFVCGAKAAFEDLEQNQARTYSLDLSRHYKAQEKNGFPAFTPSIPIFYAFDVALDLALAEGRAARGARYRRLAERLREGLGRLGLQVLIDPQHRSVVLTAVRLPASLAFEELHRGLKERGFVIYAAQEHLSGSYFRLSTMGHIDDGDIERFLASLESLLSTWELV